MNVKVLSILYTSCVLYISVVRGDSLLTPCRPDDVQCLSKTTSQFLSHTCQGIPEYDIRAVDPMVISSIDYEVPGESGLMFHFKDLLVTGLKDQRFSDFKMDTVNKHVVLTTNANISVGGDVTVELKKSSKSFTGTFTLSGSVSGCARYDYDFKEDDKKVMHYEVGPEKITCRVLGEANLMFLPELEKSLDADPEVSATKQNKELRNEVLCYISEKAYVTVIHNIRAAAKILPTTSFLIGV